TLPASAEAEKAHLQGWAVLENMSGQNWQSVELTLLSGNPVTFRQAIYEAYYINRPEVPVEVAGRVLPKPDSGVMPREEAEAGFGRLQPAPPDAPAASTVFADKIGRSRVDVSRGAELAHTINTAEAAEGMTQVSFRLPAPVTVG